MPASKSRIILTGFSGTGKSVAGPIIAERLGWRFIDTDEAVERGSGKSILEIFRDEGEEAFRDREADARVRLLGGGRRRGHRRRRGTMW